MRDEETKFATKMKVGGGQDKVNAGDVGIRSATNKPHETEARRIMRHARKAK
jgi:hypothetical protein